MQREMLNRMNTNVLGKCQAIAEITLGNSSSGLLTVKDFMIKPSNLEKNNVPARPIAIIVLNTIKVLRGWPLL